MYIDSFNLSQNFHCYIERKVVLWRNWDSMTVFLIVLTCVMVSQLVDVDFEIKCRAVGVERLKLRLSTYVVVRLNWCCLSIRVNKSVLVNCEFESNQVSGMICLNVFVHVLMLTRVEFEFDWRWFRLVWCWIESSRTQLWLMFADWSRKQLIEHVLG